MNWHNGLNWKKHLAQRERQREAYRQAGMTEAQIAAMEEFDDEVFRSDRRFYMHNISPQDELPEPMPEPAGDGAGGLPEGVRFGWEEEIGDPDLLELLKRKRSRRHNARKNLRHRMGNRNMENLVQLPRAKSARKFKQRLRRTLHPVGRHGRHRNQEQIAIKKVAAANEVGKSVSAKGIHATAGITPQMLSTGKIQ